MKTSDVSALEVFLNTGRLFAFCPWDYKHQKNTRMINLMIIIVIHLVLSISHIDSVRVIAFDVFTISEDKILAMIHAVLTGWFLVENIGRRNGWVNFFRNVEILDKASGVIYLISLRRFWIKLSVFNGVVFLTSFAWIFMFLTVCQPMKFPHTPHSLWIVMLLTTYKSMWLCLVMQHVTGMLSRRYLYIKRALMDKKDFSRLQRNVTLIFETVEVVNEIYGSTIFWLLSVAVMKSLYVFLMGVLTPMDDFLMKLHYITVVCNCAETLIFAMIILVACDKVEERHKDLLLTCNVLQPHLQDYVQREELILLMGYLENLPPRFSAAIFRLNREMISRFISILVRHFIVIVQFKRTRRA